MQTHAVLIDDDPIQLTLTDLIIRRHHIFNHCTLFTDALGALKYIADNRSNFTALPDVIITDLDMPQLSGWEFLDMLKKIIPFSKKKMDVYIISSAVDSKAMSRIRQYPFVQNAFLKPVSLITLQKIAVKYNAHHHTREAVFNKVMHKPTH